MSTAETNPGPVAETIRHIEKWETSDVEQLLQAVSRVLVRRRIKTLPSRESELLWQINQPAFAPDSARRYKELYEKLRSETIAEAEHTELMVLIQKQEQHNVERLRCLVELAQIRNESLDSLMHQLGIVSIASYA